MSLKLQNICIVTPDFIGPINNGGIGTYAYNLAKLLTEHGHRVTVLFTGPVCHGTSEKWRKTYELDHIYFEILPSKKCIFTHPDSFRDISYSVFTWLNNRHFDCVHFQDWQANGFHSIQAKQTTNAFQNTVLTVTMHSNTEWINEGAMVWAVDAPLPTAKLCWMERYCHQFCDVLLSPSQHMFDWALSKKWVLTDQRHILRYPLLPLENTKPESCSSGHEVDNSHLVFFGRLETRKGITVFCDAVRELLKGVCHIKTISFLGKYGFIEGGQNSRKYLQQFVHECAGRVKVVIHTDYDSFQARQYIARHRAISVIASLADNYPFTVLECIESKIPVIASAVGGIPEMLAKEALFAPNSQSLAKKIGDLPSMTFDSLPHLYHAEKAKKNWFRFQDDIFAMVPISKQKFEKPLVSLCMAYYNYGAYLEQTVNGILQNTYTNYEVILVNDGSTDAHSNAVFSEIEQRFAGDPRWRFITQENGGCSKARNTAASIAKGKYLIFIDSDNIPYSNMIEQFVLSIQKSDGDCITCHFNLFTSQKNHTQQIEVVSRFAPYGACLEVGLFENVFGDANCIVKKKVFQALGGFVEIRGASWEDYDLFVRLCLHDYKLYVVPEALFLYRVTRNSLSKVTPLYLNQKRILQAYNSGMPLFFRYLTKNIALPYYSKIGCASFFCRIKKQFLIFFPVGSKIYILAKLMYQFLHKRW